MELGVAGNILNVGELSLELHAGLNLMGTDSTLLMHP
jgi:hypothetical protein